MPTTEFSLWSASDDHFQKSEYMYGIKSEKGKMFAFFISAESNAFHIFLPASRTKWYTFFINIVIWLLKFSHYCRTVLHLNEWREAFSVYCVHENNTFFFFRSFVWFLFELNYANRNLRLRILFAVFFVLILFSRLVSKFNRALPDWLNLEKVPILL